MSLPGKNNISENLDVFIAGDTKLKIYTNTVIAVKLAVVCDLSFSLATTMSGNKCARI